MIAPGEFQRYLEKICCRYEQWWAVDALTEMIADRQATFSFEQMVQTEEKKPGEKPQIVSLPILKGIQNYIESEHILLVGSPGVGKSTTLLRCLVSFAKEELGKAEPRIPVLVPLKRYNVRFSSSEDPSGMLTLIRDALKPQLRLKIPEVEELLFQKRLILLLDGLNEMPADTVRTQLKAFREECDEIPLICTTRELGSGDLGIKRRLEVQPPSPLEIKRFLRECMPAQAQQVLQLLSRDNRELSRTPFVLWMLYHLFQEPDAVVDTLGEAFRQFFRSFKKYKEDAPVTDERRQAWNPWLEHLAFTMLNSPEPTDPGLLISDERAEKVLAERFGDLHGASSRIEELLKYHLLERVSEKEVSFHHQLIQEYYAAERLLPKLAQLSDEELKYYYLNYLKWTEPLAMAMTFVDSPDLVARVVKLALEVDLYLGARLAGQVKPTYQKITVNLVTGLDILNQLKTKLLKLTNSEDAIKLLIDQCLHDSKYENRDNAARALSQIKHRSIETLLRQTLQSLNRDKETRINAAVALVTVTGEKRALSILIEMLRDYNSDRIDPVNYLSEAIATEYGLSHDVEDTRALLMVLDFPQEIWQIHDILIKLSNIININVLGFHPLFPFLPNNFPDYNSIIDPQIKTINNHDTKDDRCEILNPNPIIYLRNIQQSEEDYKEDKSGVQVERYCNPQDSDKLLQDLESEDFYICAIAATQLGELGNEKAVPSLLKVLHKALKSRHKYAHYALEKVFSALGVIGSEQAVPSLVKILEIVNRKNIAENITWMSGIEALGKIGGTTAIDGLLKILNTDGSLHYATVNALEMTNDERAIDGLIDALSHKESKVRGRVAAAFEVSGSLKHCPKLWEAYINYQESWFVYAIDAIQSRCGCYNYEIYQQAQEAENLGFENNFIRNFYEDLDKVIYRIQENPELRQNDQEDRLTIDIVNQLCSLCYDAAHDRKNGGHVDIFVRTSDFVWLGEAKIYRGNNYLWEGFQQLVTRYSSGDSNQANGGLLIYIFNEDTSSIMKNWQNYLLEKSLPDYSFRPCKMRNLAFISTHKHERSGQAFHVRHIPVMLHFAPKDKSGRRRRESP